MQYASQGLESSIFLELSEGQLGSASSPLSGEGRFCSSVSWSEDYILIGNISVDTWKGAVYIYSLLPQPEYTLTITQATGGTITAAPAGPYYLGDEVTLTAAAGTGWSFSAWTGDCSSETTSTCTLVMDGPKSVSATFTEDEYALTITQATGGLITAAPAGPYHLGDEVTLTADPDDGWSFSAWTGACMGSGACVVTMDGNKSVSATFLQNAYTLSTSVVGQGTIAKDPDAATYLYGTEVTLTPTPAAGWSFSEWGGACTGSGVCVVTMDANKTVTANFTQLPSFCTEPSESNPEGFCQIFLPQVQK